MAAFLYERTGVRRYFRADAAIAKPEVYEYLEERLRSNEVLRWETAPLLRRPPKKRIIWYDDAAHNGCEGFILDCWSREKVGLATQSDVVLCLHGVSARVRV